MSNKITNGGLPQKMIDETTQLMCELRNYKGQYSATVNYNFPK